MTRRPVPPPSLDLEADGYSPEVRCGGPKPMKRSPGNKETAWREAAPAPKVSVSRPASPQSVRSQATSPRLEAEPTGGTGLEAVPHTPDGRYFVVQGRLWRLSNPALPAATRNTLVAELMAARREVGLQNRAGNADGLRAARERVDCAKRALGERGPVWWTDGAADFNRKLVKNTPYAEWFDALSSS